jgi:hypothetical protein
MPFSEVFLQNATKPIDPKGAEASFTVVREIIKKALSKLKLTLTKVDIYMHGSYANATNIFFPSRLEVCVQLKIDKYDFTATKQYYIEHQLEYGPKNFREDLYDALCDIVQRETSQDGTVKGISCQLQDTCIVVPKYGELKHAVEITPCVSFVLEEENDRVFNGILVHDQAVNADIPTFPKLHQANGQAKDIRTGGNFKRMVRLLKTLNKINKRESIEDDKNSSARGYFIECLLFNVPDNIYKAKTLGEVFLKVMNYLYNASIDDFVCQNLVWHLFGAAKEFWNEKEARAFIKLIARIYNTMPASREALVQG